MNIEDAKQLAKQGDREGAIAMLRQMLEQNEGERELVLLELGVVYNAMGETTQAINHLNEVMTGFKKSRKIQRRRPIWI